MPDEMWEPQDNRADFVAEYAGLQSPALRELLRSALGTELANGYTTAQQAHELVHRTALPFRDGIFAGVVHADVLC